jgi:hypothetical protein
MSKSVFEIASIIASTGKSFGILHYSQRTSTIFLICTDVEHFTAGHTVGTAVLLAKLSDLTDCTVLLPWVYNTVIKANRGGELTAGEELKSLLPMLTR